MAADDGPYTAIIIFQWTKFLYYEKSTGYSEHILEFLSFATTNLSLHKFVRIYYH